MISSSATESLRCDNGQSPGCGHRYNHATKESHSFDNDQRPPSLEKPVEARSSAVWSSERGNTHNDRRVQDKRRMVVQKPQNRIWLMYQAAFI